MAEYKHAVAVTPSDSADLPRTPARALFVTVTGNVSFITQGGETVSLTSVAANEILPFLITRVRSTGTTATVLALW